MILSIPLARIPQIVLCSVSWSHWWGGARITTPSDIRVSLLLIFVLVSFLCIYHFSLLSEVLVFCLFIIWTSSAGKHILFSLLVLWLYLLVFQTTSDLHFYHSFHRMLTLVLVFNGSVSSIPQGLCITFRSLLSTPCSQINPAPC